MTPIASLLPFVRAAKRARAAPACEVCGVPIAAQHKHVVDRSARRLLCACIACALAFDGEQPARFRAVPDGMRAIVLPESDLEHLAIPVGLAFFFRPSSLGRWVAIFPSVAGATEAELTADAEQVLDGCGVTDDVEAVLVRRARGKASESYVVPVATGYELTALLRKHWRGIDGGDEARQVVDDLFARIAREAA